MYPYIHIGALHLGHFQLGPFQLGTFGLLLWFAAVCGTIVLHYNFARNGVVADALNVVAIVTVAGILGAKAWHELQDPAMISRGLQMEIARAGGSTFLGFLHWFQVGFAWFGGMTAGILALMWQGHIARFKGSLEGTLGARVGALRMLDLAAPAAAIGYGVGRIGCLTSGDGDYGINTTLPWGVHMAKDALAPPTPPDALVQPTPVYEFLFALLVFWILWQLGKKHKPVGWITAIYLVLSGIGRFLVEFVRVNPKLYLGHTLSNAQMAALGSILAGLLLWVWSVRTGLQWAPKLADDPRT